VTCKGNGIGSWFRTRDFLYPFWTQPPSALMTNEAWRVPDMMLAVANELDVYVVVNLDPMITYQQKQNIDPYSPVSYPFYNQMIDYMLTRVNPYTGLRYATDPNLFLYSLLEQPYPYGTNVTLINNLFDLFARRIRSNDRMHLIGSGGLLWLNVAARGRPYSLDQYGRLYWQSIFSHPLNDVCMINVYPDNHQESAFGGESEWLHLAEYSQYCKRMGKPFMIQDFALSKDRVEYPDVIAYWKFCFRNLNSAKPYLATAGVKNVQPGFAYSIFPIQEPAVFSVIREGAMQAPWNATAPIPGGRWADWLRAPITSQTTFIDFAASAFAVSQIVPLTSATTATNFRFSTRYTCSGRRTLAFDVTMTGAAIGKKGFSLTNGRVGGVRTWNFSPYMVTNGRLYFQIYVPFDAVNRGFYVEVTLWSGTQRTTQVEAAAAGSTLIVGRWSPVLVSLDPARASEEWDNPTFIQSRPLMSAISQVVIRVVKPPRLTGSGLPLTYYLDRGIFGVINFQNLQMQSGFPRCDIAGFVQV